jgi:hypothetical protein
MNPPESQAVELQTAGRLGFSIEDSNQGPPALKQIVYFK